nr:protein C2-DOMAIN ABA-RELATED 4-like [Ipomoea batatas]
MISRVQPCRSRGPPKSQVTVISRVQPCRSNCFAEESCVIWKDHKVIQDKGMRLRNVKCGELSSSIPSSSGTLRIAVTRSANSSVKRRQPFLGQSEASLQSELRQTFDGCVEMMISKFCERLNMQTKSTKLSWLTSVVLILSTDLLRELLRCHRSRTNELCARALHGSAPGTMMAVDKGLASSTLVLFADLLRKCRLTPANSGLTSTLLEYLTDMLRKLD